MALRERQNTSADLHRHLQIPLHSVEPSREGAQVAISIPVTGPRLGLVEPVGDGLHADHGVDLHVQRAGRLRHHGGGRPDPLQLRLLLPDGLHLIDPRQCNAGEADSLPTSDSADFGHPHPPDPPGGAVNSDLGSDLIPPDTR